jgi:hypothetical protein
MLFWRLVRLPSQTHPRLFRQFQGEVRGKPHPDTSVNNEAASPTLDERMRQARLSSIHSLPSSWDVDAGDHPRAVYRRGLYIVALARALPPLPSHHPFVFSKKLPRMPEAVPPEEGGMEGLHLSVRLPLEDRHA